MDTDAMTVDQLEAHLATIDDIDELEQMRAAEDDGQQRKGAYDAIDARIAQLRGEAGETPEALSYPVYDLGDDYKDAEIVVGHADGEIKLTADSEGRVTPTNQNEVWALNELGAKPRKDVI